MSVSLYVAYTSRTVHLIDFTLRVCVAKGPKEVQWPNCLRNAPPSLGAGQRALTVSLPPC